MHARSSDLASLGSIHNPEPRLHRPRAPAGAMEGGYAVEFRGAADMQADIEAWRGLAARALEPSLLCEPDFLLPALQHLAEGRSASLMLVWQERGADRVLRAVVPLAMPRMPLGPREVRMWSPIGGPSGAPLIDRDRPEATIETVLKGLSAQGARCASLSLPRLASEGPVSRALANIAKRSGRRLNRFASERGIWTAFAGPQGDIRRSPRETPVPMAGRSIRVEHARTARDIRDAIETFLVIDALEAKECRRAPLIQDPGAASFIRTATRQFARARRCRVVTIRIDGKAAASAITLETGDAAWLWATTSLSEAEALRPALLAAIAARARRRRKTLYVLDETAAANDGVAGELGLARIALVDACVSTRPGASASAAAVHLKQHLDRRVRRIAQDGYRRLRGLTLRPAAAAG
jgi:hypothetical protein